MPEYQYDVFVIGTGPGGEGAAMQAVKHSKRVAVAERYCKIGGGCTHWGTIPSKALRYAIFTMTETHSRGILRELGINLELQFPQLRKSAASTIKLQEDMRRSFYERNHVPIFRGQAQFIDPHTIEIAEEKGAAERITAEHFVIAVGSRPYRPADVDFTHPRIFDSDTILDLGFTPMSISIYGAGVVGCEYSSMFRNLGCKLNLVNTREQLLQFLDDEICDALSYHLRETGAIIRHGEQYEKIEGLDDGVILHLKSGKKLKTDILLWAIGRTGNTDGLGLDKLGIVPDSRGQITVDEQYRTAAPHVYAVGDVIGYPSLARAAYMQGRAAAMHLTGDDCAKLLAKDIPTGIYTSPEISSIGKKVRELTMAGVPFEFGHAHF
jgi:NAD(P) transhydrogenase